SSLGIRCLSRRRWGFRIPRRPRRSGWQSGSRAASQNWTTGIRTKNTLSTRHSMNFSKRKSSFSVCSVSAIAFSVAALTIGALPSVTNSIASAAGKGLDVEVPYEINALKAPGLVAPYFLQDNHGVMVVSDQAGGVFSVTFGGKVTPLAGKSKIKNPAGVAIGPSGFGSYEGNVFVLATAGDIKAPCEVERIDKSGSV